MQLSYKNGFPGPLYITIFSNKIDSDGLPLILTAWWTTSSEWEQFETVEMEHDEWMPFPGQTSTVEMETGPEPSLYLNAVIKEFYLMHNKKHHS